MNKIVSINAAPVNEWQPGSRLLLRPAREPRLIEAEVLEVRGRANEYVKLRFPPDQSGFMWIMTSDFIVLEVLDTPVQTH